MKTETKHTPGKWHVEAAGCDKWKIFAGDEYIGVIASCVKPNCRFDADALLVAAAPDLLKACEGLLKACAGLQAAYVGSNGYKYPYHSDTAEDAARAAIAAATGEG